jgi:hypothetical protein
VRTLLIWTAVFVAHGIAQFVAWSFADSPSSPGFVLALAKTLMFPTFPLAGWIADCWFWAVFFVNSAAWAAAATWLIRRLGVRGKPAAS